MKQLEESSRRLSGKVAIVTGGAQGLGFAYAKRLAMEGASVVIADIVDCRDNIKKCGHEFQGKASFHKTDIQSTYDVQSLMDFTVKKFDRIDVLINNASIFSTLHRKPFYEISCEEWDKMFSVNVKGTFNCIRHAFPHMKLQKYGKIINIASDAIFKGLPLLLHYVSSKGAILAMTRSLAKELGPHNITVNAIAPGYTYLDDSHNWDSRRNDVVVKLRSIQRTQTPEDIVGTVAFLASSESDFITGQTIVVDGGEVFH